MGVCFGASSGAFAMIIPIAHENMGYRRWPYVTLAVIGSCVLIHLVVSPMEAERVREADLRVRESLQYHAERPYLKINPPLDEIIGWGKRGYAKQPKQAAESEEELAKEQAHLDGLGAAYTNAIQNRPQFHYGYVPARHDTWQIFTHQFLHRDWLHLLVNMWFLWLCGVNLEDRWGRAVYTPFYLFAGVLAAWTELFWGGVPNLPRIGASGAIAGAMGAFFVVFAKTRIRFATFLRFRIFFFTARAYVMLPLWFATELLYFYAAKSGQTAHGAHVGGFLFGAAVALILRQTGIDKKLDSDIEEKITIKQDPRIIEAAELVSQGQNTKALELLDQAQAEFPNSIDVQLEMLRAAKAAQWPDREIAAYGRLLQLYLRENLPEPVIELFREIRTQKRLEEIPPPLLMAIAQLLESRGMDRESAQTYELIHQGNPTNLLGVKAAIAHAKIEIRLGVLDYAKKLLTTAKESPFSTKELDDVVDEEMRKLG